MSYDDWKPSSNFRSRGYYNHLIFATTVKERTSNLGQVQAFDICGRKCIFGEDVRADDGMGPRI